MKKKNKIFIISASDRYNFGDLLFNYIVDFFLSDFCKKKYEITFTSLYGNDLQSVHGHKTIGLTAGLKSIHDGDILIFAGGGLLGHRWTPMFHQIEGKSVLKKINKIIPNNIFEELIKLFIFRTNTRYPYTVSAHDLNKRVRIIYNSVGGGALNGMPSDEIERVKTRLRNVSYISVRDKNIKNILSGIKVNLAPDSAILLSEMISKDELRRRSGNSIRGILDQDYIILHFNKSIANKYFDEIQALLSLIKNNWSFKIILMPVNYIEDSDLKGLLLFEKNSNCTIMKNKLDLFEICALIANSKLMIGSSLHTNIIACSYSIPHLGITKLIKKVNNFFITWYPDNSIFNSYDIKEIMKIIPIALNNKSEVKEISKRMKLIAKNNFKNINQTIED